MYVTRKQEITVYDDDLKKVLGVGPKSTITGLAVTHRGNDNDDVYRIRVYVTTSVAMERKVKVRK